MHGGVAQGDSATTDQVDHGSDRRTEQALVAYVRQELSAPAVAILGYAEMLMDDAVQCDRGQLIDDLKRILDASRTLHRLIVSLLDPATVEQTGANVDPVEYRRKLRHDLRTPINAIKGYGEMLREDAAEQGAETLVADLDKLLGEAIQLLDRIDGLVTFTSGEAPPSSEGADAPASEIGAPEKIVESLLKAVRPIAPQEADVAAEQPSLILVVDDNASNRDLLSRRLQRQGHTVLQAADGTTALTIVEQRAPDLILLDLMMPGISGYDVLTFVKGDPRFRDIPIIMISALSELDSVVRCIEAGADDYLAKPFDATLLRARVRSSLDRKHMRDREQKMMEALRLEKERSEQLLLNILPRAIVSRLHDGETLIADQLTNVKTSEAIKANHSGFALHNAKLTLVSRVTGKLEKVNIEMPGVYIDSNAPKVEKTRGTWKGVSDMSYAADYELWMTSRVVNWWVVILTALVIIGGISFIFMPGSGRS